MPTKKEPVKKAAAHAKEASVKEAHAVPPKKMERYVEGIGRRKTAVARVRVTQGETHFFVNGETLKKYFPLPRLESVVMAPFEKLKLETAFGVSAHVAGGGVKAQAEAVRLGLARALALKNPDLERRLHKLGFLTRDPRMVERKKYGLKKARRAPQWAKR
ncbi:MAG TPA: 30S ribosomal protein S9 [Candidatus Paceibacterota bacterium]|nr:30S ribosomal protein S9 [Candidatus Paceibacterota bacterium]